MSITLRNLFKYAKNTYRSIIEMNSNSLWKLQMCGTEEEMREVAARICRNYLHGAWKSVEPSQLEFRRIRWDACEAQAGIPIRWVGSLHPIPMWVRGCYCGPGGIPPKHLDLLQYFIILPTFSGGLSNFLYYVALPDDTSKLRGAYAPRESSPDTENPENAAVRLLKKQFTRSSSFTMEEPKKVLLRIYGQVHGERAMDAIVTESVIFTLLSERRLGPKLHGVFSGGRIEEYIPARALLTKELSDPSLSMKIAEKMAAIHSMDVPLSKGPNWLWKTMGKWLKTVKEERLAAQVSKNTSEEQRIMKRLKGVDFDKEIEWLKKYLATVDSPVVFCHNDMQEGNILLLEDVVSNSNIDDDVTAEYISTYDAKSPNSNKENNHTSMLDIANFDDANTSDSICSHVSDNGEPKLVLIDFEYCAYNYRGFDIANHFQEWMYDYTNPEHPCYYEYQDNYPTLEQKEIFIREYLKHYLNNVSDEPDTPTIEDVNHLLAEVDAFALASHLFWCLWSIVNASKSQIPFGYWEYAISRLDMYLRFKQEVIKKEKFGYPQKRKICEVDI